MTRIDSVDQLDALPIGSVCVDPYDEKGDAPVVICKNARGLWQAMGEAGVVLTADHVAHASKGRLIAVYVPGRDLVQEARADAWDDGEEAGQHNHRVWIDDDLQTNPYRDEAP